MGALCNIRPVILSEVTGLKMQVEHSRKKKHIPLNGVSQMNLIYGSVNSRVHN